MTLNQLPSQNYIIQLQISKENWHLANSFRETGGKKINSHSLKVKKLFYFNL
jgi:hypothetical protein